MSGAEQEFSLDEVSEHALGLGVRCPEGPIAYGYSFEPYQQPALERLVQQANAAPALADALEGLLAGFSGSDVLLLAVALAKLRGAGSKKSGVSLAGAVSPELRAKCERMDESREAARAALRAAGRGDA